MKYIKINAENPEKEKIEMALDVLRDGGVLIYPTDTVYGLGANATNEKSIQKIFSIKKRAAGKPISICLSKVEDIKKVAFLNKTSEKIIKKILPGPLTLILKKKEHISSILTGHSNKIGIRIPDNLICQKLAMEFPITTTSANISGKKVPQSAEEAQNQLGDKVDLIIDTGPSTNPLASTVVDLTYSPPRVLREGAGIDILFKTLNDVF